MHQTVNRSASFKPSFLARRVALRSQSASAGVGSAAMGVGWNDTEALGYWLARHAMEVDPLNLSLGDVLDWVTRIPEFEGDLDDVSEALLEEVRLAWFDAFRDLREP